MRNRGSCEDNTRSIKVRGKRVDDMTWGRRGRQPYRAPIMPDATIVLRHRAAIDAVWRKSYALGLAGSGTGLRRFLLIHTCSNAVRQGRVVVCRGAFRPYDERNYGQRKVLKEVWT